MEHHHPTRFFEERLEIGVQELRCAQALTCVNEGRNHVGFHRAGAEEGDVDRDVVEAAYIEFADELSLPWRLNLEAAERAALGDHLVHLLVVERLECVDVGGAARGALELLERVRHR